MQIIGLSGFARSGKDETAKVLVEQFGFKQVAFADKLRDFLYAMNPLASDQNGWVTVQDVIDKYGWHGYKETMYGSEIRRLLQRLGTEAGRQTMWDTIWIDAAFAGQPQDAKIVVSDARFYNEFDAVHKRGGEVWRIDRPGVGPANEHASEMEAIDYPRFDRFINNSRDLDYLRGIVSGAHADFATREASKLKNVAKPEHVGPVAGDGSITSVNVPKRKGRM